MNILVIDDDPAILESIKIILEELGHTVFVINNTDNIQKIVEKTGPKLILLDYLLNGTNGMSVIKVLRVNRKFRNIPIVFFSALNDIEELTRQGAADGYLKKPYGINDLKKIISKFQRKR